MRLLRRIACPLPTIHLPTDFHWQSKDNLPTPSPGFPQRYAGAKTLGNALGILKDKLNHEEKRVFADLLTEAKARQTIALD